MVKWWRPYSKLQPVWANQAKVYDPSPPKRREWVGGLKDPTLGCALCTTL